MAQGIESVGDRLKGQAVGTELEHERDEVIVGGAGLDPAGHTGSHAPLSSGLVGQIAALGERRPQPDSTGLRSG
jgi:hypothetical protein